MSETETEEFLPSNHDIQNDDNQGPDHTHNTVTVFRSVTCVCIYSFLVITAINSTAQFGLMIKLLQINKRLNLTDTYLMGLVNTSLQGIQILEYIILAYGFSNCLRMMDGMNFNMLIYLAKVLINKKCKIAVTIVLMIIYLSMLLVSPSLYYKFMAQKTQPVFHPYIYCYNATLYGSHITNGITRAAMIITALLTIEAWKSVRGNLPSLQQNPANENTLRDCFTSLITSYTNTGHLVSLMNTIFQGWFVIQWATYFVGITVSFASLFDKIIEKKLKYDPSLLDISANLIYFIFALAIPYACGVVINNNHNEYRKYLEEKQKNYLSQNQDLRVYIMQTASLIPIKREYLFIPSLCGLAIPLNGTGHGITILLTLLAFVLGLISKFN